MNKVGAGNRASRSAAPDGIKESASTHTEDTESTIMKSKMDVKDEALDLDVSVIIDSQAAAVSAQM